MKNLNEHLKAVRKDPEKFVPTLRGHRERFEEKLDEDKNSSWFRMQSPAWLIAAAASLLVLISLFTLQWSQENSEATLELSEVSPVHAEMENYFQKQIDQKSTLMENTRDSILTRYNFRLLDLRKKYDQLESFHHRHPGNQKVVQAMIDNYKAQLSILESLQRYIEIKKQYNSKHNEINSI